MISDNVLHIPDVQPLLSLLLTLELDVATEPISGHGDRKCPRGESPAVGIRLLDEVLGFYELPIFLVVYITLPPLPRRLC